MPEHQSRHHDGDDGDGDKGPGPPAWRIGRYGGNLVHCADQLEREEELRSKSS